MKTEGLDFLEALRALRDGKCEKIGIGDVQYEVNGAGVLSCVDIYVKGIGVKLNPDSFLLVQWKLIGVKPRTEERTVTVWLVVSQIGFISTYITKPTEEIYNRAQHVFEILKAYTYTYPEGLK